jgi:hypothetical protein
MNKLTAKDLFALQYGDRVYRFDGSDMHRFLYVGRMPSSPERYLIFSEGEKLVHLYIHTDGSFNYEWYGGDYDIDFVDGLEIERLERRLEYLKSLKK